VCTETAGGNGVPPGPHDLHKLLEEGRGLGPGECASEIRAAPLGALAVQGELGHEEEASPDLTDRMMKSPLLIGEDPEMGDLFGHRREERRGVTPPEPDEQEQSPPDLSDDLLANPD